MGGQWEKWHRGDCWALDIGVALHGTIVPHNDAWSASINTTFLGHFSELEEAKRKVEEAVRHDMRRVIEDWTTFLQSEQDEMEAGIGEVISACGGNMRDAIRSLIIANGFLEEEQERLAASISNGFARGRHRKRSER